MPDPKTTNNLTGVFRWQIVEDGEEADPERWSEASEELSVTPEELDTGDYRLLVQEQVDENEWTGAGEFAFSASAFLLPAPVINGPPFINATHAHFVWKTSVSSGWRFTVSGAGDSSFNGVYLVQDAEAGIYRHTERNDRWLNHLEYSGSHYWCLGYSVTTSMPGYYYTSGTVETGPSSSWSVGNGYSPVPAVDKEALPGLSGVYQWQVASGLAPDPEGWSEADAGRETEQTGLAPGEYRLFVREHVDGDEWTEVAAFDFEVAFLPIPAPVVSGFTPTDIFTPALDIRSNAPGPDRFLVIGAGTADANGFYAPAGTVNGFPCYKKAGVNVYVWNVPDCGSRKWVIQESANPPVDTPGSSYSGSFWYYITSGGSRPPANGWTRSNGAANAPTLQYGTLPEGEGTGGFQFRVDCGDWSATFEDASFILPEQATGVHAVDAREMGENGLWSQTGNFSIETSLIAAPVVSGPAENDGGWHITFSWSAASGTRGTRTFRYRMNGGPWSAEKAGANTGNTATAVAQLPEGYNTFETQEKSTTGNWGLIGIREVHVTNGLSASVDIPIPEGSRIVVVDPAGREYLWGPDAGRMSKQFAPMSMPAPMPVEVQYLFVTSTDKYHLPDCPYGQTGIPLTVPELIARAAIPCGKCKPPALTSGDEA